MYGTLGGLRLLFAVLKNCAKPLTVCGVLKIVRFAWRFTPFFEDLKKLCKTVESLGVLKIVRYVWRFAPSFCGLKKV